MGTVTRMELRKISELHPYEHNAKLHPPEQIERLRKSFREFGMIVPVGIDGQDRVIYGHGRLLAAQAEGWDQVPTVTVEDLTEEQRRAFIHADNLLGETGSDKDILRAEAQAVAARMRDAYLAENVGAALPVLFESGDGAGSVGHSDNYLKVRVADEGLHGQVKTVKITGVSGQELVGFTV